MGFVGDLFDKMWKGINDFIANNSWQTFGKLGFYLLIILAAIGLLILWWWLLMKGTNHGGYH